MKERITVQLMGGPFDGEISEELVEEPAFYPEALRPIRNEAGDIIKAAMYDASKFREPHAPFAVLHFRGYVSAILLPEGVQ